MADFRKCEVAQSLSYFPLPVIEIGGWGERMPSNTLVIGTSFRFVRACARAVSVMSSRKGKVPREDFHLRSFGPGNFIFGVLVVFREN